MKELAGIWHQFQLTDEENSSIDLDPGTFEEVTRKGDLCLIGKLSSDKHIS